MNINIDIYKADYENNNFSIYISENNSSGADYQDLTLEEIGEFVNDYIASNKEYYNQ